MSTFFRPPHCGHAESEFKNNPKGGNFYNEKRVERFSSPLKKNGKAHTTNSYTPFGNDSFWLRWITILSCRFAHVIRTPFPFSFFFQLHHGKQQGEWGCVLSFFPSLISWNCAITHLCFLSVSAIVVIAEARCYYCCCDRTLGRFNVLVFLQRLLQEMASRRIRVDSALIFDWRIRLNWLDSVLLHGYHWHRPHNQRPGTTFITKLALQSARVIHPLFPRT